ncbi:S-layer homology domain-containing protein [Cellulosilyticum sp. I15G10I2]|uniref:S-layer homology domain-containing protein n=1 Tax=Cellulosilyticum sp. I15G10I2 TaxID=1892843 RepID=UPI00085C7B91|nr:S-layer homology domain-containing protein [Cellulosilyticum sp. I15G10I2]
MKKILTIGISFILAVSSLSALEGEMGYFGGISTGVKLPTIVELSQAKKASATTRYTLPYKENVYLAGKPETVEGTIEIRPGKGIDKTKGSGKYNEVYTIKAESADGTTKVTRNITFETQYIYEASRRQTTKTSKVTKWTEIVVAAGQTYQLDSKQSRYTKSILEDYTPGVTYYRGDIQYDAVYNQITAQNGIPITVSVHGPIYGYEQAFAKTETQRRSIAIDLGGDQYYIEETPTFTVHKDIQYGANEPDAFSLEGNYKELIRSEGVLGYNILIGSPELYDDELTGTLNITDSPRIEQLSIPSLPKLKGHPAESDIKKMYSMKIFTESAATFSPGQAVTRQEYVEMLVRALQMPLPDPPKKTNTAFGGANANNGETSPFNDVSTTNAFYPYARAAYNAGLIGGGTISPKRNLTREEMYVLNMRAIGLERLGIGTGGVYTPFIDDKQIANSAKGAIYASSKLGIITPSNGYVFPKKVVTKAEAAAFFGQLIDYLRYDLQKDYTEKMLMN